MPEMHRYTAVVTATYEVEVDASDPLMVPAQALMRIRSVNPTDATVKQIRLVEETP